VESQLVLLIVIGSIGILLMAFSVVFFVSLYNKRVLQNKLTLEQIKTRHQEEMLKATIESTEKERQRLGAELHDGVGALLSSVKMNLQLTKRLGSLDGIDEILKNLNDGIEQVRSLSHEMMPVVLKKYGLKEALVELGRKVTHLKVSLTEWDDCSFNELQSIMLYRIVQESLNNCLKHSGATSFHINCKVDKGLCTFSVSDNGKGYPAEVLDSASGIGLWNILNRAQVLGAQATFSNRSESGACLDLVFQIKQD
jgi:two-component system, NarL family, sensor kinase